MTNLLEAWVRNQLTNEHCCQRQHIWFSVSFSSFKLLKCTRLLLHACVFLSYTETAKTSTSVQEDDNGAAPADVHASWFSSFVSKLQRKLTRNMFVLCRRPLWWLKYNPTVFCLRSRFSFRTIVISLFHILILRFFFTAELSGSMEPLQAGSCFLLHHSHNPRLCSQ